MAVGLKSAQVRRRSQASSGGADATMPSLITMSSPLSMSKLYTLVKRRP